MAWSRRRLWTVVTTALVTLVVVLFSFNFTRSEKTLERVVEHDYAVSDPQFRRELGVLLGPAVLGGNQVDPLDNGDQIFPAMLDAIRAAKRTVNLETYIYWSGDVGREFSEALAERARAGVQVNVVIDWVGGLKMDSSLVTAMRAAGARVELFRPLRWYSFSRLN